VALPGGWVGVPLAGALVAAAAMVWLRRRHRYVPPPPGPAPLDDPDLQPLPPVLTTLRRAVREHAPDLLHPTRPAQPTVTEYTGGDAETRPDLPPVGPGGTDLAGAGGRVGVGGLGLLGAGAGAAARALLVATLSSGTPADPDARGRIVIPADTLSDLLGAHAAQVGPLPRLTVTADLSEALTHVEELLIERRRVLQEHETTDVAGIRAADPFHPPMPPVLLLSQTPPPHLRARLTTTLHLGAPLQISAVLLGQWPRGDTLSVGPHGHTTGGDPTRLAVLDVPSTRQLLAVLQEAHTGQPTTTHVVTPAGPDPAAPAPRAATGPSTVEDAPPPDPTTAVAPAPTPPTTPEDHTGAATGAAQTNPAPQTRAHPPHPVRIRLLGETTILDRDNNPVPGLRHHARELLVYLAVHRSGADLSQIMEAFWPTATVRRASERLSTEAGDLRRRIRQAAADNNIQPLVNTGGHYHLHPDLLDIDVWRLIDALHQATASTEPATRIAALRQAVHTHTGGLAEGHHYDWIDQPREQLRRHGIRARLQLAQLLGGTEPAAAADLTRSAADLDPLNEDAARQSMRALAVIGDTAGIRTRLQQLRDALDDIDEEPAGETIALAAQLQRTISTAGRPGPPPAGREPGTGNRTTAPATAPPPAAHSRDRACP
jgi:DNA-binding SARP family transcriptional activator